jgi:hypothetical protein
MGRRKPNAERTTEALDDLANTIGPLVPAYTGRQLAHRVVKLLCDELKIDAADLAAIRKGKARIVYRRD